MEPDQAGQDVVDLLVQRVPREVRRDASEGDDAVERRPDVDGYAERVTGRCEARPYAGANAVDQEAEGGRAGAPGG